MLIHLRRQSQPRLEAAKSTSARTASPSGVSKTQPILASKSEVSSKQTIARPGSSYPEVRTSTIDLDAKPVFEVNGKPITEIDMDAGGSRNAF